MALEEYSILWSLRFAASFMRQFAAANLKRSQKKRAEKISAVLDGYADSIVAARKSHRKLRYEREKAELQGRLGKK
jgi:hypothetical protein